MVWTIKANKESDFPSPISSANKPPTHSFTIVSRFSPVNLWIYLPSISTKPGLANLQA